MDTNHWVPSLVCVHFEHFSIHLYVGRWSWFDAVGGNLLLSKLISMPYSTAVSCSLWVSYCNSSALLPSRSVSSANRKLQSHLPAVDTDDSGVSFSFTLSLHHLQTVILRWIHTCQSLLRYLLQEYIKQEKPKNCGLKAKRNVLKTWIVHQPETHPLHHINSK